MQTTRYRAVSFFLFFNKKIIFNFLICGRRRHFLFFNMRATSLDVTSHWRRLSTRRRTGGCLPR
ncbi:unnamed protein product [Musa textilis]